MQRVLKKIISGGQTGVDRAALDVAIKLKIDCGGWCPKGRKAEDGPLPAKYPLQETPSENYIERTEWNVRDANGLLILAFDTPTGGTRFALDTAKKLHKPIFQINMNHEIHPREFQTWVFVNEIQILNVAGPRESTGKVYQFAFLILQDLFTLKTNRTIFLGNRPASRSIHQINK